MNDVIAQYRIALADAIVTKARVVRPSADGLITEAEIISATIRKEEAIKASQYKSRSEQIKARRMRGICTYNGCPDKAGKRLMGNSYSMCAKHRKYYREYKKLK